MQVYHSCHLYKCQQINKSMLLDNCLTFISFTYFRHKYGLLLYYIRVLECLKTAGTHLLDQS